MPIAHSYVRSPSQMPCHSLVQCHCSSSVSSQSLWPEVQQVRQKWLGRNLEVWLCSFFLRLLLTGEMQQNKVPNFEFTQADWMLQVHTVLTNLLLQWLCLSHQILLLKQNVPFQRLYTKYRYSQSNPSKIMATETHLTAVQNDEALISPCFGVPSPDQKKGQKNAP